MFVSGELLIADDICSDLKEKKINLFFYMRILAVIKQLFSFNVFLVSFSDATFYYCVHDKISVWVSTTVLYMYLPLV